MDFCSARIFLKFPLQNPSDELDIQPYSSSASGNVSFNLNTYLSDFKLADEWEIISNESVRVESPRELGEYLMFSRRTALR